MSTYPLHEIDRMADRLLTTLRAECPGYAPTIHAAGILAALAVVFPNVPADVLAERIAASLLASC